MPISDSLRDKLLQATVGNVSYTTPTVVYAAVSTADMTGNSTPTEPTGNGYSRSSVAFGTASGGEISNTGNVNFSATGNDWPTIKSVAIMDASTSGNVLYYQNIAPRTVKAGTTLTFDAGRIRVQLV